MSGVRQIKFLDNNDSLPAYVKAELTGFSWSGVLGVGATVSYCFPQAADILKDILLLQPEYVIGAYPLGDAYKTVVKTAMDKILSVTGANITFIESDVESGAGCQIPIFQMVMNTSNPRIVAGYGVAPTFSGLTSTFTNTDTNVIELATIGLNQNIFQQAWYQFFFPEEIPLVITHEILHALGYRHLFDAGNATLTEPAQLLGDYSIMNYVLKTYSFIVLNASEIEIDPLPRDGVSLRVLYGTRAPFQMTDITLPLKDFAPSQSLWSWLNGVKPITSTPWYGDGNATYTLSGEGLYSPHLIIDTQADLSDDTDGFGTSKVNNALVKTSFDVDHIRCGETSCQAILNSRMNIGDMSAATEPVTIITRPLDCNHDIVFGLKPDDRIILRHNQVALPCQWITKNGGPGYVMFNQQNITYEKSVILEFNENNSLTLVMRPGLVGAYQITCRTDADIQTLLWDLKTQLPLELTLDFLRAFKNGGLLTLALGMSQELLKAYGCDEQQVAAASKIALLALILMSGSVSIASCILGFVIYNLCDYLFHCKKETSQYFATTSSFIFQAMMTMTAPEEIPSVVTVALGSKLGFNTGLWAVKKIASLAMPPSAETPSSGNKQRSAYENCRLFTLSACKKVVACCLPAEKEVPAAIAPPSSGTHSTLARLT